MSISPMLAMAAMPGVGLTGIYGAVLVGGLFGLLVVPFVHKVLRFFPSVVTGSIITMIGVSLMRVGIGWAGGGAAAADFGAGGYLAVAAMVLAIILLVIKYAQGFLANMSVLIGIAAGYVLTIALGWTDFSGLGNEAWLRVVLPLQFGLPTFHLVPCLIMCLVVTIVFIEATGMFLALGAMTGRESRPRGRQARIARRLTGHPDRRPVQYVSVCLVFAEYRPGRRNRRLQPLGLRDRRGDHAGSGPGAEAGVHRRLGAAMRARRGGVHHVRHGRGHRHQDPFDGGFHDAAAQRADRGDLDRLWRDPDRLAEFLPHHAG